MPINYESIGIKGMIFETQTGQPLMRMNNAEITAEDIEPIPSFTPKDFAFTVDLKEVNVEADYKGLWSLHYTEYVQRRRHKRKRIDKKWLHRYGTVAVDRVVENARLNIESWSRRQDIRFNGQKTI